MSRHLRPADIEEAASWYLGIDVKHERYGRSSQRQAQAKRIYWAALRELGMSWREIAMETGADISTVARALRVHPVPECYVEGVMQRAQETLDAELPPV
jgi:hypothetical protein